MLFILTIIASFSSAILNKYWNLDDYPAHKSWSFNNEMLEIEAASYKLHLGRDYGYASSKVASLEPT